MLRHATDNFLFIIYQRFYKIQLDAHTEGYNTLRAGEGFLTTKYQTFTDFFDIKRKNTQSSIDDIMISTGKTLWVQTIILLIGRI